MPTKTSLTDTIFRKLKDNIAVAVVIVIVVTVIGLSSFTDALQKLSGVIQSIWSKPSSEDKTPVLITDGGRVRFESNFSLFSGTREELDTMKSRHYLKIVIDLSIASVLDKPISITHIALNPLCKQDSEFVLLPGFLVDDGFLQETQVTKRLSGGRSGPISFPTVLSPMSSLDVRVTRQAGLSVNFIMELYKHQKWRLVAQVGVDTGVRTGESVAIADVDVSGKAPGNAMGTIRIDSEELVLPIRTSVAWHPRSSKDN